MERAFTAADMRTVPQHACMGTLIGTAVEATARVAKLPAVPTPDWLDRAARALLPLVGNGFVTVGLVGLSRGRAPLFEAVGVAVEPHPAQQALPPSGKGARPATEGGVASLIRSALASARAMDFHEHDALWSGRIEELMRTDWRSTGAGRLWTDFGVETVVAATVPVRSGPPTPASGRKLLVQLAPRTAAMGRDSMGQAQGADHAPVDAPALCVALERVVSVLGRRAVAALGENGSPRWLTDREAQVLEQLTLGRSVREIAEELGRSPHTVHDHVKALHRKLNASSRGELVALALGKPRPGGEIIERKPNAPAGARGHDTIEVIGTHG